MTDTVIDESTGTPVLFPYGLPGFEQEQRFRLVEHPKLAPLVLLQSEETADLCFVTLPVATLVPGYHLAVAESEYEALGLNPAASAAGPSVLALAIVTLPENGPASANLLAPVVINLSSGRAVQTVRADQQYSHQHPIGELCPEVSPCS